MGSEQSSEDALGPPPLPLPPPAPHVTPPPEWVPLPYAPPVPQARLHPLTLFFAAWNAIRGFIIPILVVLFLRRDARGLGWLPMAAIIGAGAEIGRAHV